MAEPEEAAARIETADAEPALSAAMPEAEEATSIEEATLIEEIAAVEEVAQVEEIALVEAETEEGAAAEPAAESPSDREAAIIGLLSPDELAVERAAKTSSGISANWLSLLPRVEKSMVIRCSVSVTCGGLFRRNICSCP